MSQPLLLPVVIVRNSLKVVFYGCGHVFPALLIELSEFVEEMMKVCIAMAT